MNIFEGRKQGEKDRERKRLEGREKVRIKAETERLEGETDRVEIRSNTIDRKKDK